MKGRPPQRHGRNKNSSVVRDPGRAKDLPRQRPRDPKAAAASPFAPHTYAVDGFAAFAEYVRFRPKALIDVQVAPGERARVEALLKSADLHVPVRERPKSSGAAPDDRVAPVSARVELRALAPDVFESRLSPRGKDLILALDHVQDPRNLGAIVRSAAFFGVREVLVPERRQVLLTDASVATAQGGFAITDLVCVVNLGRTLRDLKDQGYWILGTAMDGEPLAKLVGTYDKVVLVLGSEESGLSKSVRDHCDRLVAIGGQGPGLESLNVSVAAGIFLHALVPASSL